jgi:ERCC4-related helicase
VVQQRRDEVTRRVQQMVIFTRFYDTLTDIVHQMHLVYPDLMVGTYSGAGGQYYDPRLGRLVRVERDHVKYRFLDGDIDVLVCTDAAAEGLNLQTADLLVNFDLPWNPMKVEQRIGRIDRIGQLHDEIYVLNLCYLNSAEETVYGRLLQRLSSIGAIVGTQQLSLLPVTSEEFRRLAEGAIEADAVEKLAIERAQQAKKRTDSMEIPPRELYAIYQRLNNQVSVPAPVTLEGILETLLRSEYLRALGCIAKGEGSEALFVV